MKIFKKTISLLFLITILFFPYSTFADNAAMDNLKTIGTGATYDSQASITSIIGSAIKIFLSLLGIIFLIIIIVNGYRYMMAGGNAEKTSEATASIRRAIIGIIIIISALGITEFIISRLINPQTPPPSSQIINT